MIQLCGNTIGMQQYIKISMVKDKTAIEFDGWKYEHHFEFIWSESKNPEDGCIKCSKQDVLSCSQIAFWVISTTLLLCVYIM